MRFIRKQILTHIPPYAVVVDVDELVLVDVVVLVDVDVVVVIVLVDVEVVVIVVDVLVDVDVDVEVEVLLVVNCTYFHSDPSYRFHCFFVVLKYSSPSTGLEGSDVPVFNFP